MRPRPRTPWPVDFYPLRWLPIALARGLARIAVRVARECGIRAVGLTGGVAVNDRIASAVREEVEGAGLAFLSHQKVPPGDGGIALGQLAQAACAR